LIGDDDPNFRVLLEEYFNKQGFRAAAVGGGKDAITLLAEKEFDVALLDLVMPGMDGYDVMDYINDQELATHMIVITGYYSKQLLERIVIAARMLCHADAGTLYLLDKENQELIFEIVQNDSRQLKMGDVSQRPPTLSVAYD